jgi:hypothetical protein
VAGMTAARAREWRHVLTCCYFSRESMASLNAAYGWAPTNFLMLFTSVLLGSVGRGKMLVCR